MIIHPYTEGLFSPEYDAQANPAAGTNFIYTLDANIRAQITSVRFTLTTDANVSNRRAQVYGYIAGAIHFLSGASVTQPASTARTYNFQVTVPHLDAGADAAQIYCPLADYLYLMGGNSVRSIVNNIQAGDQISGIVIAFRQWHNPA